jgi:hypothetical protein
MGTRNVQPNLPVAHQKSLDTWLDGTPRKGTDQFCKRVQHSASPRQGCPKPKKYPIWAQVASQTFHNALHTRTWEIIWADFSIYKVNDKVLGNCI